MVKECLGIQGKRVKRQVAHEGNGFIRKLKKGTERREAKERRCVS